MNRLNFTCIQGSPRCLLALLASGAMLTAGCSNMATTAISSAPLSSSAVVKGKVHGGNQPVAFATVTLNFAGQSTPSAVVATTTTADDNGGSFSFIKGTSGTSYPNTGDTFACPSDNSDPLVYVKATGGNTLNTHDNTVNNTAAVFIAPLGLCSQITSASFVDMSEVTTVATIAALQQYFFVSNDTIAADGILVAKTAITNSFNLVSNMVNLANGTAQTSVTLNGPNSLSVTATPQTATINHIANIISSCVNNASASASNCTTLFTNAVPPTPAFTALPFGTTFSPATDVLQAAYYMLTNPTNGGSANLLNLYNLAPAVGAPYQPTLTSVPTDWTIGINYASTSTCGTSSAPFLGTSAGLAVDGIGNLWIPGANLTAISATGTPTTCASINSSGQGSVIDVSGNIWVGDGSTNNIYRYSPVSQSTLTFPTADIPEAIAADGSGNVYFSGATTTSVYMISGAATAIAAIAPLQISNTVGFAQGLFVDNSPAGAIWATSNNNYISRIVTASSGPNLLNGYSTINTFNVDTASWGLAVGPYSSFNSVYLASNGTKDATKLSGSGSSYSIASGWPTSIGAAGLSNPTGLAIDGVGNSWIANLGASGNVSEVSSSGASLSSASGFQSAALGSGAHSIAIDQSGNVWTSSSSGITEIVGAAVPIYAPYSVGLSNGRFQLIP